MVSRQRPSIGWNSFKLTAVVIYLTPQLIGKWAGPCSRFRKTCMFTFKSYSSFIITCGVYRLRCLRVTWQFVALLPPVFCGRPVERVHFELNSAKHLRDTLPNTVLTRMQWYCFLVICLLVWTAQGHHSEMIFVLFWFISQTLWSTGDEFLGALW